jgi:undecaprenyl-diphosphatase
MPIDWSLFHALNDAVATRDWLEDPVTTFAGLAVPLYAAATIALWFVARPYGSRRWKRACLSGLAAAAIAMATNQLISHLWERPRPFAAHQALTHLLSAPSPDPSFPSDHAAAAFAIAFAVLAISRRTGILFLLAATLIGLSRIALGLHYPSDVLAGILVGWTASLLVTRAGLPWIDRLVSVLSRISDPLLDPVWRRLTRRRPARSPY